MVEQSTTCLRGTAWHWVRVLVNTLIHGARGVIPQSCTWHEVAWVLQSPCWWTLSFSWDHCDCHPCWSIAHSTGDIVVINSCEWHSPCLILCSIHHSCALELQAYSWDSLDRQACRDSWLLLPYLHTMIHQPSLHTPVWCLRHLDSYFSPTSCRPLHHSLVQGDLLHLGLHFCPCGPCGPGTPSRPSLPSRPRSTSM